MDIGGEFTTTVCDIDGNQHEVTVRYKGYYFPPIRKSSSEGSWPAEGGIDLEIDYPAGIKFADLEEYLHDKAWEHYDGRF
jgi:hypothetical protein